MPNLAHGFASMGSGTSGGSGGASVTVSTAAQLQAAIDGSTSPLTIIVAGRLTSSSGLDEISIDGRNNISIIGAPSGGELDGIGIHVSDGSSNLIIQNLKIHHVVGGSGDAISIEGPSKNIWIDSNELYSDLSHGKDYYDGLLDVKRGAEYITVSNNYMHDHYKVSLVGYSDSDAGARYITYDHNKFENVGSRIPSIRDGYAHIYENTFVNVETSAINVRMGAVALVENNVFVNVRDPVVSLDSDEIGTWDLRGNVFQNVTWSRPGSGEAVAGSDNANDTARYDVPYSYTLTGTSGLIAYNQANAGIGHLGGSSSSPPIDPVPVVSVPTPAPAESVVGGGGGNDVLKGGNANDSLVGGAGNDRIEGDEGRDVLDGGTGDDTLLGGADGDTLLGGADNDQMSGGDGADMLRGADGNDVLSGDGGKDQLAGDGGKDTLAGGDGDDMLLGGADDDSLSGGGGRDRLEGGEGKDLLAGGSSGDVFVFSKVTGSPAGAGFDRIMDFATGDRIDLSGFSSLGQGFHFIGAAAFGSDAGELRSESGATSSMIYGDLNGDGQSDLQIEISGSHVIKASDFIF